MNFGRKSKQLFGQPTTEELRYDYKKNSEFNNRKTKKKKKQKHVGPTSTESETLWRETNLFWPETIALVGAIIAGAILMFVVRFMSASGLELIREMLTDQAYVEVAGLIQNVNTIFLGVAAIPFLVLVGFYAYRLVMFTPRKDRHMFMRIRRTGGIRLSVDKIKDHEAEFEKGIATKMQVNNPRKHWLENTGKPIVILFEGDDCNADLNQMAGNVSSKSREINTVNENAISFGRRIEKYIQEKGESMWANPMMWLLLIILGVVGLTAFLVLKNPETVAQVLGSGAPTALMGLV